MQGGRTKRGVALNEESALNEVVRYLQTIEQFVKDFKIHIKYPEKVFQLTQGG